MDLETWNYIFNLFLCTPVHFIFEILSFTSEELFNQILWISILKWNRHFKRIVLLLVWNKKQYNLLCRTNTDKSVLLSLMSTLAVASTYMIHILICIIQLNRTTFWIASWWYWTVFSSMRQNSCIKLDKNKWLRRVGRGGHSVPLMAP